MTKIKAQVFREFGDHGADTLERYFAQIEYTALWCIRMLRQDEHIIAVIPEAVEDVVVVRQAETELHQVKTRDESQGPWSTNEVLPILCKLYHHRKAFNVPCSFHFVSDQMADIKASSRSGSLGSLWRLKQLLEIQHDGQQLSRNDEEGWQTLQRVLVPKIRQLLQDQHGELVDEGIALELLRRTRIATDHYALRKPDNYTELEAALTEVLPGAPPHTVIQLREIYDRLLLLILRKIILGRSIETRRIEYEDVMECRVPQFATHNPYPDLSQVPGRTLLDKKAHLGGFDVTETPRFHRQKKFAEWKIRQLESIGIVDELEHLITAILDLHGDYRHLVCREMGIREKPGPEIFSRLRSNIGELPLRLLPQVREADEQFCLGILWRETSLCSAWWHNPDHSR